jgi:hypothetical protein
MTEHRLKLPESSGWKCQLFGGGITYYPQKGKVPNAMVRWLMKICFDCRWERVSPP